MCMYLLDVLYNFGIGLRIMWGVSGAAAALVTVNLITNYLSNSAKKEELQRGWRMVVVTWIIMITSGCGAAIVPSPEIQNRLCGVHIDNGGRHDN